MASIHFIFSVLWIIISAFSYGYHISALNGAQDVITCRSNSSLPSDQTVYPSLSLLTPCIAMSDNRFGFLTASYTIGGFLGSVYASKLARSRGKRNTLLLSAISIGIGSLLMSLSNFFSMILIGRTIIGIGCGINTVLVPIYLSEISPSQIRGSVGVMNQLAIVFGIFASQLVSLPLARPFAWRWIFIISAAFSTLQLLTSPLVLNQKDQPSSSHSDHPAHHPLDRESDSNPVIHHSTHDDDNDNDNDFERETLLNPANTIHQPISNPAHQQLPQNNQSTIHPLSVSQLLLKHWKQDPALANGLKVLLITQLAQQLSGINAVLYYSTSIMKSVLPTQAIYISLFITAINVLMTFPAIFLVDKLGRKCLLLLSAGSMALTSLVLALSINYEIAQLSSLAIVLFVASFSIGLGPIPFVILSELVPLYAVSAAGSLGLAVNWASNFLVGLVFLPLRNLMASPDGDGDGNVFFIFTILGCLSTFLIHQNYQHHHHQ
ncbi:hypothetical protein PGT21_018677 [Puccinia graminis f. sp. tritici]|uniref:Major facilitator superfamily (MFS) profile domain-containing protein n=2 Tax=Puccinia graminis f. sp. tritici TaxID=56615 RepID=E3K166_PUCGT|nr:uncharacterized protein PGTG_03997 [Puccinia graminis f. sp. tritici CRL 75-36-700-3]EFP78041.1 hypothetical protein PGTG_03997 [Puccinia graminis f. sp. tritici CRL 75-36-700-3]KAA1113019.1 hypothetical protein PGT21_018677 [Puccinia graminis f. sp. tritici]